jgi:hypothetical protein
MLATQRLNHFSPFSTVATVEKGEKWFNRCVANIVQVWSEFLDLPNDEPSDLYEIN